MNNNVAESTIQLLDASNLDNVNQVKDLLGQDLNAQDEEGWTALMVAAALLSPKGDFEVVDV